MSDRIATVRLTPRGNIPTPTRRNGGGWWVPQTKRFTFDGPDKLKVGDKVKCIVLYGTHDGIVSVVGSDYDGPLNRCWPA